MFFDFIERKALPIDRNDLRVYDKLNQNLFLEYPFVVYSIQLLSIVGGYRIR